MRALSIRRSQIAVGMLTDGFLSSDTSAASTAHGALRLSAASSEGSGGGSFGLDPLGAQAQPASLPPAPPVTKQQAEEQRAAARRAEDQFVEDRVQVWMGALKEIDDPRKLDQLFTMVSSMIAMHTCHMQALFLTASMPPNKL